MNTFIYRYDPEKPRPTYTLGELVKCVEREIAMRRRVYPGRVDTGRMNTLQADREIAMMLQIAEELRGLAKFERLL